MIFKRHLLYLSLPSLAFVLGLVWFRRKRITHCDTGGKPISDSDEKACNSTKVVEEVEIKKTPDFKHSQSLQINQKKSVDSNDNKFGKSAPINIIQNKSPPFKNDTNQEPILTKQISKETDLNSIEEHDFDSVSPIDLPDSLERRNFSFSTQNIKIDEPVVVKATVPAKISPKNSFVENKYTEKCVDDDCSRDSANHSPVDKTVSPIASPPLSLCSVNSADSGQGSSPPQSVGLPATTYEFLISQLLVGQLIGRRGVHVNQIKSETGASVLVKRHPESNNLKICAIEGNQNEIDSALVMIRKKLPEKRYPNLTLKRVYFAPSQSVIPLPAVDSSCLRLQLVEGINNDVTIGAIMSGGHVFLQQPLHPSYPSLNILQNCMFQSYSMGNTPKLPELTDDAICCAPIDGIWYRVQIISHNPEIQTCLVKYLDFGGYFSVSSSELRQIRTDFMTVPFQAMECLLSNIKPAGIEWTPESADVLRQLTSGLILQAQVAGYSSDGLPEIFLYACLAPDNVIFINQELVARGLAEWIEESQMAA